MATIEEIIKKATYSLQDTESLMRETNLEAIKNHLEQIIKKTSHRNPSQITSISNFDLFVLALVLSNFEDLSTFSNVQEDIRELEESINAWTFSTSGNDLITLYDNTDNDGNLTNSEYLSNITNLNMHLVSTSYNLKVVYILMYSFLKLKRDLALSEKSFTAKSGYANVLSANKKFTPQISKEEFLRRIYESNYTFSFLERAQEAIETKAREAIEQRKLIQQRKKNTEEVIAQGQKLEYMTAIPDDWHRYLDPALLEEIYDKIQENLKKEHKSLMQEEAALLSKRDKSPLTKFLYDRGYNPYSLSPEILAKLEENPDTIAGITFLLENQITIEEIFTKYISVLLHLSKEKLEKIRETITKKALTPITFKKEINHILGDQYQTIIINVSILEPIIEFTNIFYDDSILLKKPQEIKNILSVLAQYALTRNNYIFLLCHYEYITIYDLVLEQEIPVELFISICKTENPLSTIKRIMIYKEMREPYETTNHHLKREVSSAERFGCFDENLEEYIRNVVPIVNPQNRTGATISSIVDHPIVKALDREYQVDDLYIIGQANIARPKFLRNFESSSKEESDLISSLISSSILDESAYYSLYNELEEKKLQKNSPKGIC